MIIIYMDLLPRMIAIVDVICFGSVDQWNMFARSGTRTHNLEIRSQSLYRLSLPGWMTTLPVNAYRDFYWDINIILNQIKFTIWIICAFRVLNPLQWSLAKHEG